MPIRYGKVTARIIEVRGDGPDQGTLPDVVGDTTVKPRFVPVQSSFVSTELGAIATPRPQDCTIDEHGVMRDSQGAEGVWLLAGEYTVQNVPLVKRVVVTQAHTDEAPLDLASAVDYVPPVPGAPVQTVVVPAGAAEGQVLAWVDGRLTWTAPGEGGGVAVTWATLSGKPSTFPPAAHTHAWGDVTGKPTTFPPAAHDHDQYLTAEDLPAPAVTGGRIFIQQAPPADPQPGDVHLW